MRPIPYAPDQEHVAADEADSTERLIAVATEISEITLRDNHHATRGAHAKSHGLLSASFEVLPGLPAELAQGLFATPATYRCVMRFSTTPGDILGDRVSMPRGLGIKILGVTGERLEGAPGITQDFLMVDWPSFVAPNPKAFADSVTTLAKTTDRSEWLKRALSGVLRPIEAALEATGHGSFKLQNLGGHAETHVLGSTFHTQLPIRHGAYVAKYSLRPANDALRALIGAHVDLHDRPDGLREAILAFFEVGTAVWDFCAQLRTDLAAMPIEDATVEWPEALSPHIPVARITAGPQPAWNPERVRIYEDDLSFSPWHGLLAHQPMGGIMRARRHVYAHSADWRRSRNGCPMHEPMMASDLPD